MMILSPYCLPPPVHPLIRNWWRYQIVMSELLSIQNSVCWWDSGSSVHNENLDCSVWESVHYLPTFPIFMRKLSWNFHGFVSLVLITDTDIDRWYWYWSLILILIADTDIDRWYWYRSLILIMITDTDNDHWYWYWSLITDTDNDHWYWYWSLILILIADTDTDIDRWYWYWSLILILILIPDTDIDRWYWYWSLILISITDTDIISIMYWSILRSKMFCDPI